MCQPEVLSLSRPTCGLVGTQPLLLALPRGAACSNSRTQPGAKTFGGLEMGRRGGRGVGRSAAKVPKGGSVGTPTNIPQNDPHDALIIWNMHNWGKRIFEKKVAHYLRLWRVGGGGFGVWNLNRPPPLGAALCACLWPHLHPSLRRHISQKAAAHWTCRGLGTAGSGNQGWRVWRTSSNAACSHFLLQRMRTLRGGGGSGGNQIIPNPSQQSLPNKSFHYAPFGTSCFTQCSEQLQVLDGCCSFLEASVSRCFTP